ncbi:hypothetical protein OG444_22820 [Streptomyces sp. NBC_01232]|uniref:hypothetical protein n=1 Tax=Streptomyces sp. NBC_01232 TaxID=2903786 RepID=UPI002E0EF4EE|nr:hypothetical protein OG444_22820 [Streptomyces sp. NBC_01232]
MTSSLLRDPAHELPPGTLSPDIALQLAREALAKHENASIRDQVAMYFAASDLQYALRSLIVALDAEASR